MITLYELAGKNDLRFSPPCWNVKLCLLYKNIDFETVTVGFSEKNKILFSNQQLVPVLKHQDGHISDSWNIINWLDENYENPKLFVNEIAVSNLLFAILCLWDLPKLALLRFCKDHPGLLAHGPDENSGRIGLTNGMVILTSLYVTVCWETVTRCFI